MEQMPNEDVKLPQRRRRKPRKKGFDLAALFSWVGKDAPWYYDIRLWSPLILLVLILALALPAKNRSDSRTVTQAEEPTTAETQAATEEAPTEAPVNQEAAALARLADSVGSGRSDNVKTIIMWVAINRSEDRSNGYGQSLLDEIARPNQWQGYDENIAYSEHTYEIALDVLATQASGGLRPLDSDMLWLVLNDDGSVTLRNQFTASANQKWREKTVK